jgi:hypothetical protein
MRNPEDKAQLGRLRPEWEDNIKEIELQMRIGFLALSKSGSFGRHSNKASDSIKSLEFLV